MGKVMDELSSSFGPYEIGMGVGSAHLLLSAIALRVEEGAVAGAALRQAHVSIIGIEEILTALVILDMQGAERAVQLLGCDTEFLRNLRGGEARNGIEHVIAIERLRQKITHLILQLDDVITTLGDANHLFIHNSIQTADFRILFADKLLKPYIFLPRSLLKADSPLPLYPDENHSPVCAVPLQTHAHALHRLLPVYNKHSEWDV